MAGGEQYCFLVDWYDTQACLNRNYHLIFHLQDSSIELFDSKTKRTFLKRCRLDNINLADLYVGSMITVLARTMKIVDYGDAFTKRALSSNQQKGYGLITSVNFVKLGQIMNSLIENGLKVSKMRSLRLNNREVYQLLDFYRDKPDFNKLVRELSDTSLIVFEILGADAQRKWNSTVGFMESVLDEQILQRVFTEAVQSRKVGTNTAQLSGSSTCCVIRPHIVSAGMSGAVIYEIQKAGFQINAIVSATLTKPNAEEFLEVYKGVLQEYPELVDEMTKGVCVALEIADPSGEFRSFVGPHDPEIARALRPQTLRALFGLDKVRNAVHVTDLPEDAPLELDYFFRLIDQSQ